MPQPVHQPHVVDVALPVIIPVSVYMEMRYWQARGLSRCDIAHLLGMPCHWAWIALECQRGVSPMVH